MKKYGTTWAVFFLLLVLVIFAVSLASMGRKEEAYTYTRFFRKLQSDQAKYITKVTFTNGENVINFREKEDGSDVEKERTVVVPSEAKADLIKQLDKANVPVETKDRDQSGVWLSMATSFILPILFIVGVLFMFRSAQSGGNQAMSFGRSRAKMKIGRAHV